MAAFDHPDWCNCKRCRAEDREQERAALVGVVDDDPAVAAEFEPPSVPAPPYDDDPYDARDERWDKLDRERERYDR